MGLGNGLASELLQILECDTKKIISARPMGHNSNVALITFRGTTQPLKVYYDCCITYVARYAPRKEACCKCCAIGHKAYTWP